MLYFNFYRITVSGLLLGAGVWWSELRPLGMQYGGVSDWIVRLYFAIAIGFIVIQTNWRPRFNLLLTIEVITDIGIFTVLMHLNGGIQSGFSYMILVVLAGAGLVSHGRLTLFFAAVASVFVLSEHLYSMAQDKSDISSLTFAATICTSFFGTAVLAHLLSKRVVASEALAKVRGDQLDAQFKINAQVIHDMEDGLLVVDSFGTVLQFNPSVIRLLKRGIPRSAQLGDLSPTIERAYFSWRNKLSGDSTSLPGSFSPEISRIRFVATGNDDNALIYLEDAARLRAEAQQIKLAALGRLTANMAHEIRNPLAAISHAAELLGEDPEGAVTQKLSRIITDNSDRLNRIVSDVLELGRRDRAKSELIRLDLFLEELKEEWVILFPHYKGWLTVGCEPELAVNFDRSHLHRILTNLISNSFRYASGVPGCVGMIAGTEVNTGSVCVDVFDDGPGIREAERSRIFEPFFTTHNQGTGLGLYIARELSIANYGNLELLSGNSGTRFRLTITRGLH